MNNGYTIAKYIRLSIEDEKTESMSISHQRLLLDRHIDELDIPGATVLEFVDNGHSGTNMERPAIQEMLELVRSGRINCIAVKDFSRFSRNAMDSGYFIGQVFPLYQVRFLSLSDRFDSNDYKNDTGGIDVAFKFLMHEHYSKDLSAKVKSAMRMKMRSGEYFCKRTIYGYEPTDDRKLVPSEPAASVVRRIFSLALNGKNTATIRDILTAERTPTPSQYLANQLGMNTWQSDTWTARMVLTILQNEQYTGTYISGKQRQKTVGLHSKINTDKSDWIVIPDSHPPIVSREDFDAVQEILSRFKGSITEKPLGNLLRDDADRPLREKMISGERLPNKAIYGYVKDQSGKLTPDTAVSGIICEIFELAAQGLTVREIRDRFTQAAYPTPSEYIRLGRGYDITPLCRWTDKSIRGMLQNVQYTGAYVSGKILKDYETGKSYHTPKSDWVIIPGKYPAIVSVELFDKVQKILADRRVKRQNMNPRDYLLRGNLVKCGCCGYALSYDDSAANIVYRCHHTLADPSAECHKLKISAAELDDVVLAIIRKQAEVVLNSDDLSQLRMARTDDTKIADYEKEIRKCVEQHQQTYERFVLRKIDRETYLSLKNDHSARLDKLNGQLAVLKQAERDKLASRKTAAIAKHTLNEAATPREIVETLVDKILVFPDKRIEVRWKIANFARI